MPAPPITALPTQPGVAGPFSSDEADAFIGAFPDMITEMNAQAAWRDIHDRITLINGLAAQDLASPPIWVTATSYARGDVVWSPTDYFDYVRVIAGAGSTDPASDPTNWQRITGSGNATLTGAESWTNKTLKDATIQGALTEEVYTIVDGASVDIDPANGSIQLWTLGGARTPTATNFANGQEIALFIDGGGSAVTWSSIAPTWINGITPTLTDGKYAVIVLSKRGGAFEGKYIGQVAHGPARLFANGEQGAWYNPSDLSSVFSDTAGTTPATIGGTVARINDKSGRGNHATQSTSSNRPVLACHPKGGRRNIAIYTEQLDNGAYSTSQMTVTANAVGTQDRIVPSTNAAAHLIQQIFASVAGTTYTASFRIWPEGYDTIGIGLMNNGANVGSAVNLTTNTIVSAPSNNPFSASGSVTSTAIGDGSYRVKVTGTAFGTGNYYIVLYVLPDGNNYQSAGDGTKGVLVSELQVEIGSSVTAYQKVVSTYEITEAGVATLYHLVFDGVDDYLATSAFDWGVDKVSLIAGLRTLTDASQQCFAEFSASFSANNGTFQLQKASGGIAGLNFGSKGTTSRSPGVTTGYPSPVTVVATGQGDISGDSAILRLNGAQVAASTGDQGSGNYGNHALYIGRRGGSTLPLNGWFYGLAVRAAASSAAEIADCEQWMAQMSGVTL